MSKKTLLAITQDILNDLESDEVNSIDDTLEATQIANIIRTTYEEIISNRDWPHLKTMIQLTASGTSSRPTHMSIEEAVQKMINNNIRRLIVLEDKKLVGVITQTDLAEFLRSKLLIEGTVKNLEPEES